MSSVTETNATSIVAHFIKSDDGTTYTGTDVFTLKWGTSKSKLDQTATATASAGVATFANASYVHGIYYQVMGPNVTISGVSTQVPASGIQKFA
jgi:hypothetical protein